jgi:hypothetical protein
LSDCSIGCAGSTVGCIESGRPALRSCSCQRARALCFFLLLVQTPTREVLESCFDLFGFVLFSPRLAPSSICWPPQCQLFVAVQSSVGEKKLKPAAVPHSVSRQFLSFQTFKEH